MSDQNNESRPDGFTVDWLALREHADHSARSVPLTQQLVAWTKQFSTLNIVELGAGTGSNFRFLCPRLGHNQHWTLYDNDLALLQSLPEQLASWSGLHNVDINNSGDSLHISAANFSADVQWRHTDLSDGLRRVPLTDTHLVTGSALLDLTSSAWLEQLAALCIRNRCASLFVLSYNGSIRWHESIAEDAQVTALLNAHQLMDKGFGPALGPEAQAFFTECLNKEQQVFTADSDWVLNAEHTELQQALIEGWAPAALEQEPRAQPMLEQWSKTRNEAVLNKQSSVQVGHTDILSLPPVNH